MLQVCSLYYYTKPMIDMYSTIHIKFSQSINEPFLVKKNPTSFAISVLIFQTASNDF